MRAKVKATGEIIEIKEWRGTSDVVYSTTDMNMFYAENDLEFLPDTSEKVIEGWATKDYPGDDVVVHLNEPHKWKFQPEDKDEYWVSRGKKYNFVESLFPNLTPEKPQKVKISITTIEE